jgi:hypothetical protein
MLFSKLKDFEKEFLFSRVSSNLDAAQGASQFQPQAPKGKSKGSELKESINEESRQSSESTDLEKFRTGSNSSLSRNQLNARFIRMQTNRIENFKELHELLYLLVISLHEF